MRILLSVFFFVYIFPASAAVSNYSFLKKAESHYNSVIAASQGHGEGKKMIDSALSTRDSAGFQKAYQLSFRIGLFLLEQGEHAKALDIFNDMRQFLETKTTKTNEDEDKIGSLYLVIGAIYEETGLWNSALSMYMNSLQISNKTDNRAGKARVYNNIGVLYFKRNEHVKAEDLFNKAIAINKSLNNRRELFNNYNNLVGIYKARHNTAKALEYELIALNQLDINKNFYDLSIVYSNIGNLYQDMGNPTVALSFFQQAAGIQKSKSFPVGLIRTQLSISSVYENLHMLDSATFYMDESLKLAEILNNPSQKLVVYKEAAKYFKNTGNYKTAYNLNSKYVILNDSLEKLNSLTKIEQIQAVYEVLNKEKDNKILQQKVNLQQLAIQRQRIVLIGAVVIVLFFIYFVFNLIRYNRRERKKNHKILEQAELLHKQEKEFHINKENSLELELDYKNRQLTSYALHLARNSEFVQRTTDDLKQILLGSNPRDKERSDRIKAMISDLHQYSSGHDWQEFRLYFEEVHQSFEKNLSSAFPDLSPNDKKICALLKLGLSTKEIASITFRELRSVESARNRLRKKLVLAADVNIHTFLSQF